MRRLCSVFDFLIVAAIGILVVGAINWYPQLPDRIVLHLNAAGEPDGWAPRTPLSWGIPAIIGFVLAAVIKLITRWLEGSAAESPGSINVPERARFIALSLADRRAALQPTSLFLRYATVLLLCLFIYVQEGMGRLSVGASNSWSIWPVWLIVGAILVVLPWLIQRTRTLIRAAGATGA